MFSEFPIDPPMPEIFDFCAYCDGEIFEGEEMVDLDGLRYHTECFHEGAMGILMEHYGAIVRNTELERGFC